MSNNGTPPGAASQRPYKTAGPAAGREFIGFCLMCAAWFLYGLLIMRYFPPH